MDYFLGLDIGNTTVKAIVLNKENNEIIHKEKSLHFGNPLKYSLRILNEIYNEYDDIPLLISGANATLVTENDFIIGDIQALSKGASVIYPKANSLIEIGSQNARYITDLRENTPPKFATNDDCAGGTGSFFEDQMLRLGFNIEDYSKIVLKSKNVPRLSGRCSVFAKTDIIHRQQEGIETPDILMGLCYATIKNLKSTVINNLPIKKPIALGGGIIENTGVTTAIKDIFELEESDFIISDIGEYLQAIGTAKISSETKNRLTLKECIKKLVNTNEESAIQSTLKPLYKSESINIANHKNINKETICSLGIDIGSTSTNLVLIDEQNELVDALYLRTRGNPEKAVKDGFLQFKKKFGNNIIVKSVGVTGSGRYLIGKLIGADTIKDEITAQGKSATFVNPKVDTVFEIGGQDSKYISIKNEAVSDFQMNKICAAGTGSFIEEQAGRLNIKIEDYGDIALSAKNPIDLGDRCTVFIESNINAQLSKGATVDNILAGLCHSVIRNYLIKVVGNKPVGDNIILQGGVCYNKGVVGAFKSVYGEKVTVSPYFSVSGAFGVGLLAKEEIGEKETNFLGFDLDKKAKFLSNEESENEKYKKEEILKNIELFELPKKLLLQGYDREQSLNNLDKGEKVTVGIPFSLLVYKFFPMMKNYFEGLGYNVLLSPSTDEEIVSLAQENSKAETCYPVKLIYGHIAWLVDKKVDYIFMPNIITMKHNDSKVRHNYGCVYMQTAPKIVYYSMNVQSTGIKLLNPSFRMDFGQEEVGKEMIGIGISLGHSKPMCMESLKKSSAMVKQYIANVEKSGKELLKNIKPSDKVLVIITRAYGIEDPILNMNIPTELLSRGYKVITLSHLEAYDLNIDEEYENLYWAFGQHIISGAKIVASHPNLYPVFLSNHGCAPDSMIAHMFKEEMTDKPYLNIEVDEHYSKVGVVTRIEAFLNSLDSIETSLTNERLPYKKQNIVIPTTINKELKTYLPNVYPYSEIIGNIFNKEGYNFHITPKTTAQSIIKGRSVTTTKEYLNFVSVAGDVLSIAENTQEKIGVFIPQTEGSEIEGIFPRVIWGHLDSNKSSNVTIFTKTLETLPYKEKESFDKIFTCILAGDIALSLNSKKRDDFLKYLVFEDKITVDSVINWYKNNKNDLDDSKNDKKVLLVGDPYILFNDVLSSNIFRELESDSLSFKTMPLLEYLMFLWYQGAETEEEKTVFDEVLIKYNKVLDNIQNLYNFEKDFNDLITTSKDLIGYYVGANGGYRIAKHRLCKKHTYSAVIDVTSMYENTQTILNLIKYETESPLLYANFEGTSDINMKDKIKSFLYYI